MKKYTGIQKLSDNKFLNLFHLDALTDSGHPFDYFFVSRRKADQIKLLTKDSAAEGVVIFPVLKEDPEKVVLIRQYRYPLDDVLYELPAGLIDAGETPECAAIREMKEETGLSFEVYSPSLPESKSLPVARMVLIRKRIKACALLQIMSVPRCLFLAIQRAFLRLISAQDMCCAALYAALFVTEENSILNMCFFPLLLK